MEDKPLHGQILRQTEQVKAKRSWDWLKKGDLKKEAEGLITATQDQAPTTNVIKTSIENRMCLPSADCVEIKMQHEIISFASAVRWITLKGIIKLFTR